MKANLAAIAFALSPALGASGAPVQIEAISRTLQASVSFTQYDWYSDESPPAVLSHVEEQQTKNSTSLITDQNSSVSAIATPNVGIFAAQKSKVTSELIDFEGSVGVNGFNDAMSEAVLSASSRFNVTFRVVDSVRYQIDGYEFLSYGPRGSWDFGLSSDNGFGLPMPGEYEVLSTQDWGEFIYRFDYTGILNPGVYNLTAEHTMAYQLGFSGPNGLGGDDSGSFEHALTVAFSPVPETSSALFLATMAIAGLVIIQRKSRRRM